MYQQEEEQFQDWHPPTKDFFDQDVFIQSVVDENTNQQQQQFFYNNNNNNNDLHNPKQITDVGKQAIAEINNNQNLFQQRMIVNGNQSINNQIADFSDTNQILQMMMIKIQQLNSQIQKLSQETCKYHKLGIQNRLQQKRNLYNQQIVQQRNRNGKQDDKKQDRFLKSKQRQIAELWSDANQTDDDDDNDNDDCDGKDDNVYDGNYNNVYDGNHNKKRSENRKIKSKIKSKFKQNFEQKQSSTRINYNNSTIVNINSKKPEIKTSNITKNISKELRSLQDKIRNFILQGEGEGEGEEEQQILQPALDGFLGSRRCVTVMRRKDQQNTHLFTQQEQEEEEEERKSKSYDKKYEECKVVPHSSQLPTKQNNPKHKLLNKPLWLIMGVVIIWLGYKIAIKNGKNKDCMQKFYKILNDHNKCNNDDDNNDNNNLYNCRVSTLLNYKQLLRKVITYQQDLGKFDMYDTFGQIRNFCKILDKQQPKRKPSCWEDVKDKLELFYNQFLNEDFF